MSPPKIGNAHHASMDMHLLLLLLILNDSKPDWHPANCGALYWNYITLYQQFQYINYNHNPTHSELLIPAVLSEGDKKAGPQIEGKSSSAHCLVVLGAGNRFGNRNDRKRNGHREEKIKIWGEWKTQGTANMNFKQYKCIATWIPTKYSSQFIYLSQWDANCGSQ